MIGDAEKEIRVREKSEDERRRDRESEQCDSGRREGMACVPADASPSCFLMRRSFTLEDRGETLIVLLKRQ